MSMNLSVSSTKFSIIRRRFSPYFPLLKWAIFAAAITLAIFFAIRLGAFISRPLSTLNILTNPADTLKRTDGRANILILGRGGAQHDAPDLTDTIILASIRLSDFQITLISIPRDVWIPPMKAKVNTAYYYGRQKNPDGGGFALAKDAIFQITNLPIHYLILIDMDGLKKAIDLVGGIDVEVERSFTDVKYPATLAPEITPKPEEIYETVSFQVGKRHFDGDTALKFSRSRNSDDPMEGTDFARARRQQLVLTALAKKIKSRETVLNLDRVKELKQLFDDHTDTDLSDREMLALAGLGAKVDPGQIRSLRIDEMLINPPVAKYGQWVLVPRSASWEEIHSYIKNQLSSSDYSSTK
jgi:LCP family protein required for cell wall assembly